LGDLWYGLMANLAVVTIFVAAWTYLRDVLVRLPEAVLPVLFGIHMGLAAIGTMLLPIELRPGIFFDLRASVVIIAAFLGGPVAALIGGAMALAYRVWVGGAGAVAGSASILVSVGLGIFAHWLMRRRPTSLLHAAGLAALSIVGNFSYLIWLPQVLSYNGSGQLAVVQGTVLFAVTLVSSMALIQDQRRRDAVRENIVYRSVIDALPDGLNVKDIGGTFLAANPAAARLLGVSGPEVLIGRRFTDFYPADVAERIAGHEAEALSSNDPRVIDQDVVTADGSSRRLSTLKVPLRDADGHIVGIITHNRDVTDRYRLEVELERNREQFGFALANMTDGVAMFDSDGRLVFSNEQYRLAFPLTGEMRQPGVHIRDILRVALERGEQVDIVDGEAWVEEVARQLFSDAEEEVHLYDGRWLRVRTRPTEHGASMVVVSDITRLKLAETDLLLLNDRLRLEASTDALTGLMNRRAMDEALASEIARSARDDQPISVILLDIDWFKAYNDLYGHQAGDECLVAVGNCFRDTFRRTGDAVARYGGEEFLAILPSTDEDGAYHLSSAFRANLAALAIPHRESPRGVVTASLGIATYKPGDDLRRAGELVARADEALYGAKRAGRDRINGWHRRGTAERGRGHGVASEA
jgi:diguanylate cyclase (GGDEF)-like protein/PAS domain S-box-containing protein